MSKMTTAILKEFIVARIAASPTFKDELEAHDIDDVSPAKWKRTKKNKISKDMLFMYEFLFEAGGHTADMFADGMGRAPTRTFDQLECCIERGFLHLDGDCYVGIITDPTDSHVVAWSAQVD